MSVAIEARTGAHATYNTSSFSYSHTHPTSLTDDALVVVVHCKSDANLNVTAVTYDGVSMTKLGESDGDTYRYTTVSVWYLVGPSTGSNTVAVSLSGTPRAWHVEAISLSGVDQTTPLALGTTGTSAGPWSETMTTAAGSQIWFVLSAERNSGTFAVTSPTVNEYDEAEAIDGVPVQREVNACAAYKSFSTAGSNTLDGLSGPATTLAWMFFEVVAASAGVDVDVTPAAADVDFAAVSPVVVAGALTVAPSSADLALAAVAPVVLGSGLVVVPAVADLAWAGSAPVVLLVGSVTVGPAAAGLAWVGIAPGVSSGDELFTPAPAGLVFVVADPTVVNPKLAGVLLNAFLRTMTLTGRARAVVLTGRSR